MRFDLGLVGALGTAAAILSWGCTPALEGANHSPSPRASTPAAVSEGVLDEAGENVLAQMASNHFGQKCESSPSVDEQTVSLYGKACTNGDALGCVKLGALYACGRGVEKNGAVALAMFDKSCALHNEDGCQLHAAALLAGNLGKRDTARGLRLYERECDAGSAHACGSLGSFMMLLGKVEAEARGLAFLEKACTGGHLDSCGNLAVAQVKGLAGRPANPTRGVLTSKAACEKNNAFSCGILGMLQLTGEGTPKDEKSATKLLESSCKAGEASGCTYLAACFYQGLGVAQDVPKATELFRKGCDAGNGQACRLLAEISSSPQASSVPSAASPTMF